MEPKTAYIDVKQLESSDSQKIIDCVVSKVNAQINSANLEAKELRYVGGYKLIGTQWYLITDGHELEKAVCAAFPKLKHYTNLPREIVNKVLSDLPNFVPTDLLELFQKIQNG